MALPPSQTRVCNSALAHLGEGRRIVSVDEGTPLANLFQQVWDEAVAEVLAEHPWNVALKRAELAVAAGVTPDGTQYTQAFAKPADCLRWLPWRRDHPDYFEGEEEGSYILSDADAPIAVRYIASITNIALWPPGMLAVLAAKLARKLARPITGQSGMMDRMAELEERELSRAKRQDGAATGDRARGLQFRSDWLGARQQSWNGNVR